MNSVLCVLLSIILEITNPGCIKSKKVPFTRLPRECAAEYNADLRQSWNPVSTNVSNIDLDGDGTKEMLIFTGNFGTGGETWRIMRYNGKKYIRIGEVFGFLFEVPPPHHGLIVYHPLGWEHATWTLYQIRSGKLQECLEVNVRYGQAIRKQAIEIKIRYCSAEQKKGNP